MPFPEIQKLLSALPRKKKKTELLADQTFSPCFPPHLAARFTSQKEALQAPPRSSHRSCWKLWEGRQGVVSEAAKPASKTFQVSLGLSKRQMTWKYISSVTKNTQNNTWICLRSAQKIVLKKKKSLKGPQVRPIFFTKKKKKSKTMNRTTSEAFFMPQRPRAKNFSEA